MTLDATRAEPPPTPPVRSRSSTEGTDATMTFDDVEPTFRAFCGSRQDLDGRSFSKLCKLCGLFGRGFSACDADIVFASASRSRRLDLSRFEEALRLVAERKGMEETAIRKAVACSTGPTLNGTQTLPVRFYDERNH